MLINITTQQQLSEHEFKASHPNTSFPEVLSDEMLSEFGVAVLNYPEPTVPIAGQKIVSEGIEQIEGQWFVRYGLAALNDEESQNFADGICAERNQRLSECDWTQVADAQVDKAAWAAYRQALRDITLQPGFPTSFTWPTQP